MKSKIFALSILLAASNYSFAQDVEAPTGGESPIPDTPQQTEAAPETPAQAPNALTEQETPTEQENAPVNFPSSGIWFNSASDTLVAVQFASGQMHLCRFRIEGDKLNMQDNITDSYALEASSLQGIDYDLTMQHDKSAILYTYTKDSSIMKLSLYNGTTAKFSAQILRDDPNCNFQ